MLSATTPRCPDHERIKTRGLVVVKTLVGRVHGRTISPRRIERIAAELAALLPAKAKVLDVGSGDGYLATRILEARPDIEIIGIDIMARPRAFIPVQLFDGQRIPFGDASFDAVIFVDVLHHTDDPSVLLHEAKRVSRGVVLIKDHYADGLGAALRLRLMDWVGNAPHGVRLPYNYWTRGQWRAAWEKEGLGLSRVTTQLGLYPWPLSMFFDRSLHFVAELKVA
jgi:SAM-dependent methyltransferase